MHPAHRLRLTANVLNGSTLAGIVVASAGGARLRPAGDGLLVGSGYQLPVPRAAAFCLGNVLVTRLDHAAFTGSTRLFTHEVRHATQYACCGGLVMLPLYGIAAAVSWALTGDFGSRNVFEQRAGLADGGYTERDLRPLLRRAGRSGTALRQIAAAQRQKSSRSGYGAGEVTPAWPGPVGFDQRAAAQVAGTSAPPSSETRAPKRSRAGSGEIFPAIRASPWRKMTERSIRLGGTKENAAWAKAASASEFSRISTRLSAWERTFSAIFCGRCVLRG